MIKHQRSRKIFSILVFLGILAGLFIVTDAQAALQIKQVLRGQATFLNGDDPDSALIIDIGSSVDVNKSIVLVSSSGAYNAPGDALFSAIFDDASHILIQRGLPSDYYTTSATVEWQVVEFADGVNVTSNYTVLTDLSKEVTLPFSLDSARSLVIVGRKVSKFFKLSNASGRSYAARNDECWEISARISDYGSESTPAKITLQRSDKFLDTTGISAVDIYYQIIEFDSDVNVQYGAATIANGSLSGTAALTSVDTAKSMLFFTSRYTPTSAYSGIETNYSTRGEITNGTTLTFTRNGTTGGLDIAWFVLTFQDGSTVKKGVLNTIGASATATLTPNVVLPRSFSVTSASAGSGTDINGLDDISFRQVITASNISAVRDGAGTSTANIPYFVAELPAVKVVTPNGAETLAVGDLYNITWRSAASVANVKIEYSDDNGSSWKQIIASIPAADRSYAWTVGKNSIGEDILPAAEKDTDCLVRVSDIADANNNDISNAVFAIQSKLQVSAPNTAVLWYVGDTGRNITWNKWGNFTSTVKLQYSIDAAHTSWNDITGATALSPSAGTFNWSPLPLFAAGKTTQVRVVSNSNSDIFDASDVNFEIRGTLTLTAPVSTDEWATGYPHDIAWTLNCTSTQVNLYYSVDNGSNWYLINTSNGGESDPPVNAQNIDATHGKYTWTPPLNVSSDLCKVKVIDISDPDLESISDTFKIKQSIKVDQPNGNELWKVDQAQKIKWTLGGSTDIASVTIKYCTDFNTSKTWVTVVGGSQVAGSLGAVGFDWTVPDAISNYCAVRIEKYLDPTIYDESDAAFRIKGWLEIINPPADIKLRADQDYNITWTPHGSLHDVYGDNFRVAYSTNGGTSFVNIYTAVNGNAGEKLWSSADIPLTNLGNSDSRILVGLVGDDDVSGQSGNFYVRGNIVVTFPNGGNSFNIGDHCLITWTAYPAGSGQLGTVRIAYSKDSGNDGYPDPQIINASQDASAGLTGYDWTIPDADLLYNTVRVQVRLATDPTEAVKDESDNDFTVKGALHLSRPSELGGPDLVWECGSQENISWTRNGTSMGPVDIYFSRNGGLDLYAGVIDASGTIPSSAGNYLWTIPATYDPAHPEKWPFKTGDNGKNPDVKIKLVSNYDPTGVKSISTQLLTIKSRFTSLVPNGGSISVGSPFNITWITQGDIGTVNVKYSDDGGSNYNGEIALNRTNAEGWYWNPVNCPVDNDIRIRVESISHSDIKIDSGSNIDAKGRLEITSPSSVNRGDNALIPGETHRITWITNGGVGSNVGLVDLYYAEDGNAFGSPFTQIDTAVQNYYDWTIPNPASLPVTTAKVKIQDNSDSSVNNTSEAFDIRGKFWNGSSNHALIEPNGGEVYYAGGEQIRIQWSYKGNIGTSELYYDNSGGSGGYLNHIATVAHNKNESAGICYHDWTVPAFSGASYRVKIYAVSDQVYCYANSQANFVVKGSVLLTSPGKNPGAVETWFVDADNQIVWTASGGVNDVDILYDKYSGLGIDGTPSLDDYSTLTIVSRAPSADGPGNTYLWSILPAQEVTRQLATSNTARVRVRDSDDTTVYSSSTNDFYMKPRITIGAIAGSPWTVQEQKTISWTKTGNISQLNLYYSSDGQSGPWGTAQITGIDAAAGSTLWTIPNSAVSWGNAVLKLVRVESGLEDTDVFSKTGNFTIKGKINVTAPVVNQTYNVTQTGTINWNTVGTVGSVDIKYNTNSAAGYPDQDWVAFVGATGIVSDYCTNLPGTPYTFTIPASTAPNVKIRVVESSHAEVFGPPLAGSPTHKFKGSIIFDKGNTSNQILTVGTAHRIDWSLSGDFTVLRAYYKKVGAAVWTQIGADLGGTVTNINYMPIDSDITALDGSNKVLFRVEDALDANDVYAETPALQGNTVNGYLEILEPVAPAEFTVGNTTTVKWKKYGNIGDLKFELWDGSAWLTNATGSNLPDTYASGASGESGVLLVPDWTVPDKIGSGRKIRVSSINYPALTSSTGEFTVKGGFSSLETPTVWYVGEEHIINWEANGTMSSVKIELYNGLSWTTIEDAYSLGLKSGSNSYTWSAADTKQQQRSSACKIKITSNQNPSVYIETGNFTLVPKITVDTPAQAWIAQSNSNSISWSAISAPTANVDIILEDTNAGLGYPVTLASNIAKGSSPYSSTAVIPATLTAAAKIKVRDTSFPSLVYGESGTFKVIGQITMHPTDNTPNSTSNWEVGSSQFITWTHKGNLGQVNIRYKYDGGAYSMPLAGCPVDVANHTYTWAIPEDVVSENVQVKIESVNNPTEEFAESAVFKLKGKFTLDQPGTLNSGSAYTISWTQPVGQDTRIPDVVLEYYNGTSWNYIIPAEPHTVTNSGSYGWTVPSNFTSSACKLRVSDYNNVSGMDETDAFSILPVISVTAPTTGVNWLVGTQAGNNIIWGVTGYVPTVRIEYSKDSGSNYTYIITPSVAGDTSPFEWNIPTNQDIIPALGQSSRIRVINTSLGAVYGLSGLFTVKGSVTVTSPSASTIWKIGESTLISWTTPCSLPANMGNLKIEFRKSPIDAWSQVVASVAFNSSPYTDFVLPLDAVTANGKTAQIKITQLNNTDVFDESDSFEIEAKVAINEPNTSGLTWTVGSYHNIKWTPTGTYSTVEFHYSTDNFVSSNILIGQATNSASGVQGVYEWNIPTNVLSDTVRVRVRDAADPDVKSVSAYDIKLVGGLDVTAPETQTPLIVWYKGESKDINWTANGAVTNVNIDYSTNGGTGWTNIVTNESGHTAGSNTKTITVPDENSENCLVKVSDTAHALDVYSVSAYPFAIRPVITVTQPAAGQGLAVGSNGNTVAWSLNGSTKVSYVKLYYSKDGGAYTAIDDSGTVSATAAYTWNNIPDIISEDVKVRVIDNSNPNVYGTSASFRVVGSISVLSPSFGQEWEVGSSQTISWSKKGTIGSAKLYYLYKGSYVYINTVDTDLVSSYSWNPLPNRVQNDSVIKMVDLDTEGTANEVFGLSAAFYLTGKFAIDPVQSVIIAGSPYTVTWNNMGLSSEIPNAKLEFFDGTSWHNIDYKTTNTGIVSNSGSYSWSAPTDVKSLSCAFRVSDPNHSSTQATSNNFEMRGVITVTQPALDVEWNENDTRNIVWSITGVCGNVKIEYSPDNGTSWPVTLVGSWPSVNPYPWTLDPLTIDLSNTARIRVSDSEYATLYGISQKFTVLGDVNIEAPIATDKLTVGSPFTIRWNSVGSGMVDISYSKTGVPPFTLLYNIDQSAHQWVWTPGIDTITSNQKTGAIEIKYTSNPDKVKDVSQLFEVEGKITMNTPDTSGLMWTVNSSHDIEWTPTGTYSPVKVEYSTNGFVDELQTYYVASVTNSASGVKKTWGWTIPNAISDTVKVRVSDENDADVKAVCPYPIKIVGSLDVTAPESATPMVWYKGEAHDIAWVAVGDVTNVKIEYKTFAAGGYTTVVVSDPGHTQGGNTYSWTVPDENSEDCYVRVSDAAHYADVYSVSAYPFSIRPLISVTAPTLNENLLVGGSKAITWNLNGSLKVNPVTVQWSKDGGAFVNLSQNIPAANLAYTWNPIPDQISNNIVFRILDGTNTNVYADSAVCHINGSIVVTQPDASSNWQVASTDKTVNWTYNGTISDVNIYYDYGVGGYQLLATGISKGTGGAGSWAWPSIPDTVSTNVKVKVAAISNEAEVYDESDVFKIRGGFTNLRVEDLINNPVNVLQAGDPYYVKWTTNGSGISSVILEFSSDNGNNWSYVNPVSPFTVSNTGSYSWSAPVSGLTDPASNCLIKVTDPNNSLATLNSALFEIRSRMTVTDPTLTDEWTVGAVAETIAWNTIGSVQNVNIDYSKDNGSNWINIKSGIANTNSTSWNIPTDIDLRTPNQAKIRVVNSSYGVVYAVSSSFKMKGLINVTSPTGTDILHIGIPHNITWTTTGFFNRGDTTDDVVISYSVNSGSTFTAIATVDYNYGAPAGTYPWTLPIDSITQNNLKQAMIEVKDLNDSTQVRGVSSGFDIEGQLELIQPSLEGIVWAVGSPQNIIWKPQGTFSYVKIEYSTNGFADENQVVVQAASYPNSAHNVNGTYPWTVPDAIGDNLKVRVSANTDPDVKAISLYPFEIKGALTLSQPNGGETWYVGETNRKIMWLANGTIPNVRIEYSKNNGGIWADIIASTPAGAGAGEYTWPSVADAISNLCLVRVSDTRDSTVKDESNGVFYIKGKLQLTAPTEATRWLAQSSNHNITWIRTGSIADVKITYAVDGGGFTNVITNSVSGGNLLYRWDNLPNHVSSSYRVKIEDVLDPDIYDISPNFNIVGSITVTKPDSLVKVKVGENYKIEWTRIGDFANVRIEYSPDNGVNYTRQIIDSTAAGNLFYWWNNIPNDTVSVNAKIKVTDTNDILTTAESQTFKVQGVFDVTSPDLGTEKWIVGSTHDITWTTVGNVPNITLEYSTDGGGTWVAQKIAENISNNNIKSWVIPATLTSQGRVKVSDASDPESFNISAANFKIRGDLQITAPDINTQPLVVGAPFNITWNVTGPVTNVKLQYSVDGGVYQDIVGATNLPATPSSFSWTVPNNISSQVKIKIVDLNDPVDTTDESDIFTITGKIDLTAPLGGETWYVGGSGYDIAWTKTGTIPTVKVEYSVSGGAYQVIQDADNLSTNSFRWVIPNDALLSSQVKIRVSNTNALKPTIPGVSDYFTVKGRLTITNPQANVVWDVGKLKDITWAREGQIGTINLFYDYGSGFNPIAGAQGIDSSLLKYTWTVPNSVSGSVIVRAVPTIASELDISDSATFKIAADIGLVYPAGGEVLVVDNPETIVWTKSGTLDQVRLKYDTNSGLDNYPNTIATLPASDLGYTWPVPDAISDTVRIKIEDPAIGNNTESYESGNFVIRGSILITSPAGIGVNKQVWICRENRDINYTIHGSISNVQIRLSLDNGLTYPDEKIIVNSLVAGPGNHTYNWTVPDDTSTQAMIKILQVGKVTIYDESDPFTIRGGFTISQPNASSRWLSGSIGNTISWTTMGIIPRVYIRYSLNAGGDWNFINDGSQINNLETYSATIPSVISYGQAQIRISDANDPAASNTSANFTINGSLTLTAPNGQEKFKAGQNDADSRITWTMVGPIESVYMSLSTTGLAGPYTDINTVPYQAGLLSYQWNVPSNLLSNNCYVRIRDAQDALVKDESNAAFKIMDNFSISSPVGSERWIVGTQQNINWSSMGLAQKINIKYCNEPTQTNWLVVTPSFISNATSGSYLWTVPPTVSATCRVKVIGVVNDIEDNDSYAISPADFVIRGQITVISPNGSTIPEDKEKWGVGSIQTIRWTGLGVTTVDLHYYNGSVYVPIDNAQGIGNTGQFEWTIPYVATDLARVRVRDSNTIAYGDVFDTSDETFRIIPRLTLTRPNGLETWLAGTTEAINWTKDGPLDYIEIDYSIDDSNFIDPLKIFNIVHGTDNDGAFDWTIPGEAVSGKVRVRISKFGDTDVQDISSADFRVRARFTIITPDGGQNWVVGSQQNIIWNQIGQTQGVKITYYKQTDPSTYDTFTLNNVYPTGNNSYAWTIPSFIQPDLMLKVEDKDDNGAYDLSTSTFKIMRGFTVTAPAAGAKWYVGDPALISWTYTGSDTMVGIYYSLAGGAVGTWNVIPGSSVMASAGQWQWPSVPNYITSQLKIKVGDANDADAYGIGPTGVDMAKILAKFAIAAPAGGEEWVIGSQHNITWSNTGTVATVDLHYSTDNFVSETREIISDLANGAQQNGATYSWTIPDIFQYHAADPLSAHQVRVRVKSHTDTDAYAISNSFRVKGEIWINAPVLNAAWEIGKSSDIKWGWQGTMPEVQVTYFVTKYTTGTVNVATASPVISGTGVDWLGNVAIGDSIGIGSTNPKNITKWYTIQSVNSTQLILASNYAEGNAENQVYCIGRWAPIAETYGTPNDGIVANGAGSGGAGSEFLRSWLVPDQANDNVLIKVADVRNSESDIYSISDLFKIIGYLIIKTPTLNAKLAVDSLYQVKWEWGGTMPLVGITLSTNAFADEDHNVELGNVANGVGPGGAGSEQIYNWTVPDNISPNCKLRIFDPRVPSVQSVSPQFKIQGAFSLVSPVVAQNEDGVYECRWIVGEVREIKWDTFGTIPNVDLVYSKDNFVTEIPMTDATNLDNSAGTYNWTIPNERLTLDPYYVNVKMRVYDHNDHDVYVQGPTPAGGVDVLKIDYYKITWDIRDLLTNQPIAGLKVNDTSGLSFPPYYTNWIAEGLTSPVVHWVRAGNWHAEFSHKDYGPISEDYLVGWDPEKRIWRKDRTIFRTMETLVVHIWRAYSEFSYDVATDNLSIVSWLERDGSLVPGSLITDVTIFDGIYKIKRKTILVDEANNKHLFYTDIPASVKLWTGTRLNNNGTPEDPDDDYEETRSIEDVIADCAAYKTGESPIPVGFNGFFTQVWSPTNYSAAATYPKLQSGKVYTVASYVALATGATFTTPVSFSVTIPQTMSDMKASLDTVQATVESTLNMPIATMESNLRRILAGDDADPDEIAAQGGIKGIVEQKLNDQEAIIREATADMMAAFDSVLVSFESKTQAAVELLDASSKTAEIAGQTLKSTAEKYSWRITISPDPALPGDEVTLTVTGLPNKNPVLNIYSWDNKILFNNQKIKEVTSTPGVYTYQFTINNRFASGKAYSFIMTERDSDAFEIGSGMVESMSLTTIAGLASAAPGAERAAKKALDAIKAVEAVLVSGENINIALTLKNLRDSVDALPGELAKEGPSARLNNTVDEISDRLKALGGKEGLDLSALFEKALSTSPTVRDMRTKTDEIGSVIEILKQIFEAKFGGKDAPVVSATLAPGSVKFRIVAVNPSMDKTQIVQVKYDLPQEVKPQDIADLGGLDLEYDSTRSIHYVYKTDLELAPNEVRVFEVDVEDIWLIAQDRIADLKFRVDQILARLEQTDYYSKAKEISDTIYPKLNEILVSQADDTVSRERHIGVYRQNLLVLGQVKEDIARMEKILVTAGGPASPEMLAKTKIKADEPNKTMTWIIIFVIIIFTGLLAGVLFFSWNRQSRMIKGELTEAKNSAFPESGFGPEEENKPAEGQS